jgi:hypothetical protein
MICWCVCVCVCVCSCCEWANNSPHLYDSHFSENSPRLEATSFSENLVKYFTEKNGAINHTCLNFDISWCGKWRQIFAIMRIPGFFEFTIQINNTDIKDFVIKECFKFCNFFLNLFLSDNYLSNYGQKKNASFPSNVSVIFFSFKSQMWYVGIFE